MSDEITKLDMDNRGSILLLPGQVRSLMEADGKTKARICELEAALAEVQGNEAEARDLLTGVRTIDNFEGIEPEPESLYGVIDAFLSRPTDGRGALLLAAEKFAEATNKLYRMEKVKGAFGQGTGATEIAQAVDEVGASLEAYRLAKANLTKKGEG